MVSFDKRKAKSDPDNQTSIFLLSVVGKVFERILAEELLPGC